MALTERKSDKEYSTVLPAKRLERKYTYGDYLTWNDEERWEIINAVVYNMSPAPSWRHQDISVILLNKFYNFLFSKDCRVYSAPFDVILQENGEKAEESKNVVQPDIFVICDRSKLQKRGCVGAPDLIIEILSPATAKKDMKDKFDLYEKFGVKEYWIIHPEEEIIEIFKLGKDGKYSRPEIYASEDKIEVGLFNGELIIDLSEVFGEY